MPLGSIKHGGAAQAFLKIHFGYVADYFTGTVDGSVRMADISGASISMFRFRVRAHDFIQGLDKVKQRIAITAANVEDIASTGGPIVSVDFGTAHCAGTCLRLVNTNSQ